MLKMCFIIGLLILAFPFLTHSFDCNNPDFCARIEDLNKDGYFVWYMEKGGISYYNYTDYESLRAKLKYINEADDPASLAC